MSKRIVIAKLLGYSDFYRKQPSYKVYFTNGESLPYEFDPTAGRGFFIKRELEHLAKTFKIKYK